jgi:hypothetical protein
MLLLAVSVTPGLPRHPDRCHAMAYGLTSGASALIYVVLTVTGATVTK